jgi:hypothetical protein
MGITVYSGPAEGLYERSVFEKYIKQIIGLPVEIHLGGLESRAWRDDERNVNLLYQLQNQRSEKRVTVMLTGNPHAARELYEIITKDAELCKEDMSLTERLIHPGTEMPAEKPSPSYAEIA